MTLCIYILGMQWHSWLRHRGKAQKVTGLNRYEVIVIPSVYVILPATLCTGDNSLQQI